METTQSEIILNRLDQILERLDQFESRLKQTEEHMHELPGISAMAVNTLDAQAAELKAQGIDLSDRLEPILKSLLEISRPENMQTIEYLSKSISPLNQPEFLEAVQTLAHHANEFAPLIKLMADIPGIVCLSVDSLDQLAKEVANESPRHSFAQLAEDLRKGLLNPHHLTVLAALGQSLARSEQEFKPVSIFEMLKALSHPGVKQSLGFLLSFAQHFGCYLQTETKMES